MVARHGDKAATLARGEIDAAIKRNDMKGQVEWRRILAAMVKRLPAVLVGVVLIAARPAIGETFHGYECTVDCSGHEAGYNWAEEHGITDPEDCSGNSQSFIEGCRAYAGDEGSESDDEEETKPDSDDSSDDE